MKGITDFLATTRSPDELRITLEVLREFKACESKEEWFAIPFAAWVKLEQAVEFLEHLVEGQPLKPDTLEYVEYLKGRA